jgi:invasion protein IalB
MLKTLTPIFPLALMAFATLAQAQNQTAINRLDLGEDAASIPQLGERYSKETYEDWELACIRTEADEDPCSLLQVLVDQQGAPVAEISLFRLEEGGQAVAGATIIVPLETYLPAQLTISIDGAPGKRYSFSFCNVVGCVAQVGLTAQDIEAYKRGKSAAIQLVPAPAPDQIISLPMSLTGFSAGYEKVDVVKQ